jgi:DNA-3-methyladenine glycosylase II
LPQLWQGHPVSRLYKAFHMKLTITPVPPYDFDLSARIFSTGDEQIRKYENGRYQQVIGANNKLILITVKSSGSVDAPVLEMELKSNRKISENDRRVAEETISYILNLGLDLETFYQAVKSDRVMAAIAEKLRGLKNPTTPTVFESLISSIIEQQISLIVAHSMEKKVVKAFGEALRINDLDYYIFPTPQRLASATREELRHCGLSEKKAEYIRDVSKSIIEGKLDLEALKELEDTNTVIDRLLNIRGIGLWTAEMTVLRGMRRLEEMPADDIGLRRCIAHYYSNDRRISADEARQIARKWGKWQGLAGFYLIIAEHLGIEV